MDHLIQGAFHLVSFALQKGLLKPLKGKNKPKCFRVDASPVTNHKSRITPDAQGKQ